MPEISCSNSQKSASLQFNDLFLGQMWCAECGSYFSVKDNSVVIEDNEKQKRVVFMYPKHTGKLQE